MSLITNRAQKPLQLRELFKDNFEPIKKNKEHKRLTYQ
jgi:hypothetical protein